MTDNQVFLGLGGGELWQIANRTPIQMMSYMIKTPTGETVIIDGGNNFPEEAENLYSLIKNNGISAWFFTHAHSDHVGALLHLLENREKYDIKINKLIFSFPPLSYLKKYEDWAINERFLKAIEEAEIEIITPKSGEFFHIGGMDFEILNEPIIKDSHHTLNPTGIIIKAHFPKRSVLFLGDFDKESEEEFIRLYNKAALRCDIVQMAHHGQNGVSENFYKLIKPRVCLYAAPKWLWENNLYATDDPATRGKGPFATLETREWMKNLGALVSYTQAEGDYRFI